MSRQFGNPETMGRSMFYGLGYYQMPEVVLRLSSGEKVPVNFQTDRRDHPLFGLEQRRLP